MKRRPTLHFLCGKLASGKTTLARRLAQEHGAVLIIEDVWLNRLYPGQIASFQEYLLHSARFRHALSPHLLGLLRQGISVVLDFAGNRPEERNWVRSVLESGNFRHRLHYIHASDDLCKLQLAERNQARPEGATFISDEEFDLITAYFIPPVPEEGFDVVHYRAEHLRSGQASVPARRVARPSRRKLALCGSPLDEAAEEIFAGLEEPAVDAN